jgi:Ca2+-binding EF-hand superfamily protein
MVHPPKILMDSAPMRWSRRAAPVRNGGTPMSASDKTRQDFAEIDVDGDGYITASELLRASVKNNPNISDDDIASIVQMADADGDNKISYEEYARFVR